MYYICLILFSFILSKTHDLFYFNYSCYIWCVCVYKQIKIKMQLAESIQCCSNVYIFRADLLVLYNLSGTHPYGRLLFLLLSGHSLTVALIQEWPLRDSSNPLQDVNLSTSVSLYKYSARDHIVEILGVQFPYPIQFPYSTHLTSAPVLWL